MIPPEIVAKAKELRERPLLTDLLQAEQTFPPAVACLIEPRKAVTFAQQVKELCDLIDPPAKPKEVDWGKSAGRLKISTANRATTALTRASEAKGVEGNGQNRPPEGTKEDR